MGYRIFRGGRNFRLGIFARYPGAARARPSAGPARQPAEAARNWWPWLQVRW